MEQHNLDAGAQPVIPAAPGTGIRVGDVPTHPPSLILLLLGEGLSFPLQARHRPLAALETSAAPRGSDPLGFPAGAARRSPAGTRGCPKDEHMFNNPEIRAPKPSLAWPGPLVSPDAQTTQLFLKLGQKQAPGRWQRWEGLFSPAWELQNKGQTLGIVSFPRLRERPLSASPGAGSRWIPGGHHGGDITAGTSPPAPDTCCHPSSGQAASASLFTRLLPPGCSFPAGFCTLHMQGQAVPPPRVTGASCSASSASNTIFCRF